MKFNTIKITETSSTNTELKRMAAEGAEVGTVLVAQRQTAGKGRMGKSFSSGDGGLYVSIILPYDGAKSIGLVTTGAAVAVSRAVEKVADVEVGIKWVNDLCVCGRKICGILAEAVTCGNGMHLILGVGVNLTNKIPAELEKIATTLREECGKKILPEQLLEQLLKEISMLEMAKKDEILNEYRHRSLTVGKKINVIPHGGGKYEAKAVGILDDGSLLVEKDGGETVRVFSGEVSTEILGGKR